jgi:hypothetical protein
MADKLHTLTSNLIKFAAGEKPSADKFNAANEYFSRSLREISRAIGDIRDQGYPYSSDANKYTHLTGNWNPYEVGREEGRPLDIVNIARLIGPASNLNPKMLSFETTKAETISGSLMEYQLSFPLKENGTIIIEAGGPLTKVTTDYFTGINQFLVKGNIVYFSSSHNATRAIIYETSTSEIDGGANYNGASFNVIPDPNQPTKLSIIPLQNEINAYSVDLGLCTHQQSGIRTKESLKLSSLNAGEYNNNLELKLPAWMWSGENPRFENGDTIPEGFLVLKNLTTNEVYQNASYFFISPTEIHVKGISLCVDHEFCVITVGTDITTSIDDLRNKMFLHKHDGSFGEPRVSVRDLIEKFSEYSAVVYGESTIPNNHFPMYLHRSGFSLGETNLNNGNNAMLGALVMGRLEFSSLNANTETVVKNSATSTESIGYGSQPIIFSSFDCYLRREDNGTLLLKNSNYKNIDIEAKEINLKAEGNGDLAGSVLVSSDYSRVESNESISLISKNTYISNTEDVIVNGKNIKNRINYNVNPEEWGYFSVEGTGTNSELLVVPLSGVFIGGDEIGFKNNYNKKDNLNDIIYYKKFKTNYINDNIIENNYIKTNSNIIEKELAIGKLIKSNESISLVEPVYVEIKVEEILPEAISLLAPALLPGNVYAVSSFYEIVDIFNPNFTNLYHGHDSPFNSNAEFLFPKYFKFNEDLNLISTSRETDIFENDYNYFQFKINKEDTCISVKREINLLPLDNGKDVIATLGNSHFCFLVDNSGHLSKRKLLIKKIQNKLFTSAGDDFNVVNYLIKMSRIKLVEFKLKNYVTNYVSATYTREIKLERHEDVNIFELVRDSHAFNNDLISVYNNLCDIDFEIEIIEDFEDVKINIIGRYYA